MNRWLPLFLLLLSCSVSGLASETVRSATPEPRIKSFQWMSLARWYRMHAEDVELAEKGEAPIVFLGDSITEIYENTEDWKTIFAPAGAVDFGIGGDMTQNLLWRLDHGAVGKLAPKAVVLLIGVNNFGHNQASPEEVALGVRTVVYRVREIWPEAKLLLYGIFPWGESPDDPRRAKIARVNADLAHLDDGETIFFEDLTEGFLEPDGTMKRETMPDFLHPSATGYAPWTKSLEAHLGAWGLLQPSADAVDVKP